MPYVPKLFCGCSHEMYPADNSAKLKVYNPSTRNPYYVVNADRWACGWCGVTVYLPAQRPVAMNFDDNFETEATGASEVWLGRYPE